MSVIFKGDAQFKRRLTGHPANSKRLSQPVTQQEEQASEAAEQRSSACSSLRGSLPTLPPCADATSQKTSISRLTVRNSWTFVSLLSRRPQCARCAHYTDWRYAPKRREVLATLSLVLFRYFSVALRLLPLYLCRVDALRPGLGRSLRAHAPVSRQTNPNPVWHSPRFHSRPATLIRLRSVPFTVPPCFFPLPLK